MAAAGKDGNRGAHRDRMFHGPRALGRLLPAITRPAFRKQPPASAQIAMDWAELVGPALAARTHPRRLSGATLTIGCDGPMALELQHLAPELLARLNGRLGRVAVERLRFVQLPPAMPPPAAATPPPPAEAEARRAVAALEAGPLRDALESLGRRVLAACRTPASG